MNKKFENLKKLLSYHAIVSLFSYCKKKQKIKI